MAAIFNSAILNLAILDSAILVFPLKLTHIVEIGSHHLHKKTSLIHSDSTWRWQPSWTLPCWIQPLPSWIQTPCYLLSDSLKNTLIPIWLWLKLIQSDQLDDGSHLEIFHFEFCHLGFSHFAQKRISLIHFYSTWWWQPSWIVPTWIQHLSFSSQTHSHLPRLVHTICTKITSLTVPSPPFAEKTSLIHSDSTWWWDSHLGFRNCHLGFRHLVTFSQTLKNTLTPLWLWLKLIKSD